MLSLEMVSPDRSMKMIAERFVREFHDFGETFINGSCGIMRFTSYEEWLDYLKRVSNGLEERFASETFFLRRVHDQRIVGIIDIRKSLSESMYHFGHIGGSIVPSQRGKGYGTEMCALGIAKAREYGNEKVVISCLETNVASRRMIEKNGLSLESRYINEDGETELIFSIALEHS